MSWTPLMGFAASSSAVALYLTGIPICQKIKRKGNTAETSFFPFLVMFCNAALWLKYGLLKADSTLIYVNTIGAVINLVYMAVYYTYTTQKGFIHRQMLFGAALVFPILIYLKFYAVDRDEALFRMGLFTSSVGVLAYGAPLASMAEVVRTKTTECMSLPLSLMNCIVAVEWCFYGYLRDDLFIQVPNFLGFLLGTIQLGLFVNYPQKKSSPMTSQPL